MQVQIQNKKLRNAVRDVLNRNKIKKKTRYTINLVKNSLHIYYF